MTVVRSGIIAAALAALAACAQREAAAESDAPASFADMVAPLEARSGFLDLYADAAGGRVLLALPAPDAETGVAARAIYIAYLRTGLGSNPVGLDRGLGATPQVVAFTVRGPKVYLEAENTRYVASSDNAAERRAVAESFARSILWAGDVAATADDGRVLVDISSLLASDALHAARQLKNAGQGSFALDAARSAPLPGETLAFPDNVELEAFLTFASDEPGGEVRATAAAGEAVTLTVHHSFTRLPDDGFRQRAFDPRMGVIAFPTADYAAGLDAPIERAATLRFRLEKEDPAAERSPAKKPIVFYVDPGAPAEVRAALIEGASWWSAAFEAAGFKDAFRVEVLPDGAHPLDARYNVIQWVHRQTRGWSYGSPIYDPRTGEIIKAVVTLGSLRVRQDRMIFEGLIDAERTGSGAPDDPVELALARLRQLAAHEVGHGLGFPHNMAASTNDRASVMDYPAPLVTVNESGAIDVRRAYAVGVGPWDVASARYLYTEFPDAEAEAAGLAAIVRGARDAGLNFVVDAQARPIGGAHPDGSLWDNGADPVAALDEALAVRAAALSDFGLANIPDGAPASDLRRVVTPIHLWHRYEVAAAAKLVGGARFGYAVKDGAPTGVRPVPAADQRRALEALLRAVDLDVVMLPAHVAPLLEPAHASWFDGPAREELWSPSAPLFDEAAAAATASGLVFDALLNPARASRLVAPADPDAPDLAEVLDALATAAERDLDLGDARRRAAAQARLDRFVQAALALAESDAIAPQTAQILDVELAALARELGGRADIERHLERDAPARVPARPADAPPGSPIGGAMAHAESGWHDALEQP